MDFDTLVNTLPIERRLALAYSPARARAATLALFGLDQRLAALVGGAREPVLGQIKLAWWREQLAKAPAERATGEPLLALIASWGEHGGALVALVDGWEQALDQSDSAAAVISAIARGRAGAAAALAHVLGQPGSAEAAGRAAQGWAVAEFAVNSNEGEDAAAWSELIAVQDWSPLHLPRELRALTVLFGLARRSRGTRPLLSGPLAGLAAIRLGLFGI